MYLTNEFQDVQAGFQFIKPLIPNPLLSKQQNNIQDTPS